jgi:F-type H+-transporting ATPase subunit a
MLGKHIPLQEFIPATEGMNIAGLNIGTMHGDTILVSWGCMAFVLIGAALITPMLTAKGPGNNGQGFLEMLYEFVADITKGQIGHEWRTYFPLIAAIFIFVLTANFAGILPWQAIGEGMQSLGIRWPTEVHNGHTIPAEIAAPSTDFNVTFGLALVALLTYIGAGFYAHGLKYLKLYINPIEWLDLIIRPATLSLRLMMVITADELMRAAALMMVPVLLPSGVMMFEMFIGVIQAFVFALLTSIYIGLTVSHH